MLPSRSCLQGGLIGSESVDWENTSTDQEGKKRKNQAATLRSNLGERLYTKCHAIPFLYMVTTRTSRRDAFISSFYFFAPPFIDFFSMQPETRVPQVLTKQVLQCYFGAEARKPLWNSKSPDPKMAHYPTHSAVLLTVGGKRVREKVREHTGTR